MAPLEPITAAAPAAAQATIIAYMHSGGFHCPECTRESYRAESFLRNPRATAGNRLPKMYDTGEADENGVGKDALQPDGSAIWPVTNPGDIEATGKTACEDCHAPLLGKDAPTPPPQWMLAALAAECAKCQEALTARRWTDVSEFADRAMALEARIVAWKQKAKAEHSA